MMHHQKIHEECYHDAKFTYSECGHNSAEKNNIRKITITRVSHLKKMSLYILTKLYIQYQTYCTVVCMVRLLKKKSTHALTFEKI